MTGTEINEETKEMISIQVQSAISPLVQIIHDLMEDAKRLRKTQIRLIEALEKYIASTERAK